MNFRAAAFFDLDNTLINGDSQDLEIRHLARKGRLPPWLLLRLIAINFLYKMNLFPSEKIIRECMWIYKGKTAQEIEKNAGDLIEKSLKPRLRPRIVQRLEDHLQRGHLVAIMSASMPHLVKPLAETLGVDHVVCTRIEKKGTGLFTGRPKGDICIGKRKAEALRDFCNAYNLNLEHSYAYSDHHSDMDFLRCVGHPVAVTPTKALRQRARENGWPILEI